MTPPTYSQPVKEIARRQLIGHAVDSLTGVVGSGHILGADIVSAVASDAARYLVQASDGRLGGLDECMEPLLAEWKTRFAASHKFPRASDLRALYLAGPEPTNDARVFIDKGLQPCNIIAVEGDRRTYGQARSNLDASGLAIELHHSTLANYLKENDRPFDIIYFDACGPFMGGQPNTLGPILEMVVNDRLSDRCALITNFSQAPEEPAAKGKYAALCAAYFSPRYNDLPKCFWDTGLDPAVVQTEPEKCMGPITSNLEPYYSDFITRFLVDIARYVIPVSRALAFKDSRNWMLAKPRDSVNDILASIFRPRTELRVAGERLLPEEYARRFQAWFEESLERHTWELSPGSYPLFSFLSESKRLSPTGNDPICDVFRNYSINQMPIRDILPLAFALNAIFEGHWDIISEQLKVILGAAWFDHKGGIFCDVPLPHLLVHALTGKAGRPFHVVAEDCLRIKYTARVNAMFCDCLILDRCRQLYDWLPDPSGVAQLLFSDVRQQILIRAMLDRIQWQDWGSSTHPFRGAALFGMGEKQYSRPTNYPERVEISGCS